MTKQSWYWVDSFCILMSEIWVSNLFILFNLLTFIIPPRVLKILYESDGLIFFYSLLFTKKVQCNTFSSLHLSLMLLEITYYCDLFICTTFFEAITVQQKSKENFILTFTVIKVYIYLFILKSYFFGFFLMWTNKWLPIFPCATTILYVSKK